MLAYNKTFLKNTFLKEGANSLLKAGFIQKEQKEFIDKQLPSYNKQNILVRIGLFILGCLFYSSCCALFSFITAISGSESYGWVFFLYAVFGFFILEFVIHKWNYFANGLDDAFLFSAEICLIVAAGFIIGDLKLLAPLFLITAIIGIICCTRYVDQFSAFLACAGITAFVIRIFIQGGDIAMQLLPFIVMLLAFFIYLVYLWLKKKAASEPTYVKSLNVVFVFSLLLFYLGGNYFVVREASRELMNTYLGPGEDISLAFIFYGLTFLIPSAYIYFSLKTKSRILLWSGLLTFGFSIFSIRYYYDILPAEIALILGGIILFAVAYYAMNKFKGKTTGITFEPDRFENTDALSNLEVLALIQKYSVKPDGSVHDSDVEFGGGEFGGGGSGNKY